MTDLSEGRTAKEDNIYDLGWDVFMEIPVQEEVSLER